MLICHDLYVAMWLSTWDEAQQCDSLIRRSSSILQQATTVSRAMNLEEQKAPDAALCMSIV